MHVHACMHVRACLLACLLALALPCMCVRALSPRVCARVHVCACLCKLCRQSAGNGSRNAAPRQTRPTARNQRGCPPVVEQRASPPLRSGPKHWMWEALCPRGRCWNGFAATLHFALKLADPMEATQRLTTPRCRHFPEALAPRVGTGLWAATLVRVNTSPREATHLPQAWEPAHTCAEASPQACAGTDGSPVRRQTADAGPRA